MIIYNYYISRQLWIVCLTCVLLGISCAAMFVPPYLAGVNLARYVCTTK